MEINEYQVKLQEFECAGCKTKFKKTVLKDLPTMLGEIVVCPTCRRRTLWFDNYAFRLEED